MDPLHLHIAGRTTKQQQHAIPVPRLPSLALLAPHQHVGNDHPFVLAAVLLCAMEAGVMTMNPDDHRLVVMWARAEFARLDIVTLRLLRDDDVGPLREIIENELYVQAERRWTTADADHDGAESAWIALHERCRKTVASIFRPLPG